MCVCVCVWVCNEREERMVRTCIVVPLVYTLALVIPSSASVVTTVRYSPSPRHEIPQELRDTRDAGNGISAKTSQNPVINNKVLLLVNNANREVSGLHAAVAIPPSTFPSCSTVDDH